MTTPDPKSDLHRYLRRGREDLLSKLDGLSEYDVRRPMTRTGTNLLGVVKHLAAVTAGYFGEVFDRPFPEPMHWMGPDAEPNQDMWATAEESREQIVGLYEAAGSHADATIEALDLDAVGHVPWWPEELNRPTLHTVLVHMIAETHRHAGHLDIVRELIDGSAGRRQGVTSDLPSDDDAWWAEYRDRLERVAREVGGR